MDDHPRPAASGCDRRFLLAALLLAAVVGVYAPTLRFGFVSFDDPVLVSENRFVRAGMSLEGVAWAFSLAPKAQTYWHPLTWLSHMADCQLWGLAPSGHHLTNLLLHATSTITLFLLLNAATGAPGRSAVVAALFGLHPINVESVAWIAGRKNLLSTLFWLLAIASHVGYSRRASPGRYLRTLALFSLGLLAKPMLVTFPIVLLLLDWWPLGRFRRAGLPVEEGGARDRPGWPGVLLEKLPLLVLAGLAYAASSRTLSAGDNLVRLTDPGLGLRAANAVVSCCRYLGKLIWPQSLIPFYPYPTALPALEVATASAALVGLTLAATWSLKRRPWGAIGWLWFLITLGPVIGLVQTGLWPALADRWAYVPAIGIFLIAAWAGHELLAAARLSTRLEVVVVISLLLLLAGRTWIQTRHWHDSSDLFRHTLAVDPDNYLGLTHLGAALLEADDPGAALPLFRRAAQVNPASAVARSGLGLALGRLGNYPAARRELEAALALRRDPSTLVNLGGLASAAGDDEVALASLREAVRLDPGNAAAHNGLGVALAEVGRLAEAAAEFRTALRLEPALAEARSNLERCDRLLGREPPAQRHPSPR